MGRCSKRANQPQTRNIVLENGRFDTAHGTTADTLRALIDSFRDRPDMPLAVHFHGGLVELPSGLATAEMLAPLYTGIGAYPTFRVALRLEGCARDPHSGDWALARKLQARP